MEHMAETKGQKSGFRYPPPSYTQFDAKDREQFLSEIGNFTPLQREIFHTLCKTWQPEIPYSRLIAQISATVKNGPHEVDRLLEKLSEKKCGLITVRYVNGEPEPEKILLTTPGDCRYHFFRLTNELEAFYADRENHLPLETFLAEKGFRPPSACIEHLEEKDFSRVFDETVPEDYILYRVALSDGQGLLLPPGGGTRFINHCLSKMRESLIDTNLAGELARLLETSIADLKRRLETKDPLFWMDITKTVHLLKNDLRAGKRASVPEGFYQTAEVLSRLIECHLTTLKRRKMEKEERLKDMEALALQMEKEKDPLITHDRFNLLIGTLSDKYGDGFEEFRKEFFENFVEFKAQFKVPPVVFIGSHFLHRNNFYQVFLDRLFSLRGILEKNLILTMERLLRTGNRERKTVFFSRDNFETGILELINESDPILKEIFEKPRLLTEVTIYTQREKSKVKDMEIVKIELEKYFRIESMTLKSFSLILHLTIIDIFLQAFFRLPWWRQLWIRITGKFKSYQNQYMEQSQIFLSTPVSNPRRNLRGRKPAAAEEGGGPRMIKVEQKRKTAPQTVAQKKSYTRKQQESAWEEFSRTIKPKRY